MSETKRRVKEELIAAQQAMVAEGSPAVVDRASLHAALGETAEALEALAVQAGQVRRGRWFAELDLRRVDERGCLMAHVLLALPKFTEAPPMSVGGQQGEHLDDVLDRGREVVESWARSELSRAAPRSTPAIPTTADEANAPEMVVDEVRQFTDGDYEVLRRRTEAKRENLVACHPKWASTWASVRAVKPDAKVYAVVSMGHLSLLRDLASGDTAKRLFYAHDERRFAGYGRADVLVGFKDHSLLDPKGLGIIVPAEDAAHFFGL